MTHCGLVAVLGAPNAAFSALQARAEATGGASEPASVFVVLEGWDKEVLRGTQIADRSLPSTQLVAHITNGGMIVESVQDAATSVAAAAAVSRASHPLLRLHCLPRSSSVSASLSMLAHMNAAGP